MLRLTNIKLDIDKNFEDLINEIKKEIRYDNIWDVKISNKSIDARNKNNIKFVYSVDFETDKIVYENIENIKNLKKIEQYNYPQMFIKDYKGKRPIVVGTGPAGMFAALILASAGLNPIIIERGKSVEDRTKDVYKFFNEGILDEESNVQYGEGGAGTFSDGKLTTNTHNIRIQKVIEELILAGANENISYIAKPHLGTDELVKIVKKIREKIESLGGSYLFSTKLIDLGIENDKISSVKLKDLIKNEIYDLKTEDVILAIGHSARDTFEMLKKRNISISKKPFSVGVRIEHKQEMINKIQYGKYYDKLPAAEYKLNVMSSYKRGVYTFCMCPGGLVVPAASEKGYLVVNGMSYSQRDLENANSAVLVNIMPDDLEDDVLSGMYFQRELEKKAFILGGSDYKAPVQLVKDYILNRKSKKLGTVSPSYSIGYKLENINEIFPEYINLSLREGMQKLENKLPGFASKDSIITGVETRTSSPIRINRDLDYYSNIKGLIPCGEGAGYAGGIMSSAVDGIKCAEKLIESKLK